MKTDDEKLLKLSRQALGDKTLSEEAFSAFSKDYTKYSKGELTFRELMESIKNPKGALKIAMENYYNKSNYNRVFKGR